MKSVLTVFPLTLQIHIKTDPEPFPELKNSWKRIFRKPQNFKGGKNDRSKRFPSSSPYGNRQRLRLSFEITSSGSGESNVRA